MGTNISKEHTAFFSDCHGVGTCETTRYHDSTRPQHKSSVLWKLKSYVH